MANQSQYIPNSEPHADVHSAIIGCFSSPKANNETTTYIIPTCDCLRYWQTESATIRYTLISVATLITL